MPRDCPGHSCRVPRPNADDPVVSIEGSAPEFVRLYSTEELAAKPVLSIPLPGGKSYDLPRPDPKLEFYRNWITQGRNVAGLLVAERSKYYFTEPTWTIDGHSISVVPEPHVFRNALAIPTAFGTKPVIAQLKPNSSEAPIYIKLPPNGRPAPVLEEKTFAVDGWKITFKPRPVVANLLPFVYDVTAEGPSDKERVTLLWFGSMLMPWVLVDPKATIAVWYPEPVAVPPDLPQMLTIDFVRSSDVDLVLKRSLTSMSLLDSGREVWRADWSD